MAAAVGGWIPFHRQLPAGLVPAAFAETVEAFEIPGKSGLILLNDRPINAETPPYLLDDLVTPTERHFVRNNGLPPDNVDAARWRLTIDGAVERPLSFSIAELRREFEVVELALQIECGGNGRASFNPPASGNQWTLGAIGNSRWTGVRLRDVLQRAGLRADAVYTGHFGADAHLTGVAGKLPISRGMPMAKAMDPHTLIAFEQNGGALHPQNGAPLRLVVPGWPGSLSHKWLTRIEIATAKWTGPKMAPPSYSVPSYNARPGQTVAKADFRTIEAMPVKSMITAPINGHRHVRIDAPLAVRGHAWAGDGAVQAVEVSIDFGASWQPAALDAPLNPFSWQAWRAAVRFPVKGYFEVWARATDVAGRRQPLAVAWNPKGYLNNAMHRIAVRVGAA